MESSFLNPFAKEQLQEGLKKWPKSLQECCNRASLFKALKEKLIDASLVKESEEILDTLARHTEVAKPLLRKPTQVELEGYSQVFFQGSPWATLNSIPFALVILSFYKSYVVPAFGLVLPLLSWILPYIMIRAFWNIPISFHEYSKILWRMWNGQPLPKTPDDLLRPAPEPPKDIMSQVRQMIQNGWTLVTLGQAMYQPIQQARHFMRLDKDCLVLGNALLGIQECGRRLYTLYKSWFPSWFGDWLLNCPQTARQAFAFSLESPFWLRHTLRGLGRFEVLYRLASRTDTVAAEFVKSEKPVYVLKDFGAPAIPLSRRILSSVSLGVGGLRHAIVTGPNRGGKSSFLRAMHQNILYSHTFGCVFAARGQLSFYTWVADGLTLHDTPGDQSMFEREVAFTSSVLQKEGGCGIVFYDELFHSTNPPDATRSSKLFCEKLWKKENCLSFVSTHIYSLAKEAPSSQVKQLCLASWRQEDNFKFSYTVQKGVCEVSSVDLLLKQFGILA